DTSQQWCGRTQRSWEWGKPLQLTALPLWWRATFLQATSPTKATLRQMCSHPGS
ncbi:hypothetical protein AAFF_G00205770, partial [Aldrovandia affinis]